MNNIVEKNFNAAQAAARKEAGMDELMSFEGWGRVPGLLDARSDEFKAFARHDMKLRGDHEEVMDDARKAQTSVLTSYYTPQDVATAIRRGAEDIFEKLNGYLPSTMLEPSAGSGRFLTGDIVADRVTAVEIDPVTCHVLREVARLSGKDVKVINDSFGNLSWNERYDIIVSNIPFGDVFMEDGACHGNDVYSLARKKIHDIFFLKAANLLSSRGILAFITSRGFISSPENRIFREEMMRLGHIIDIIRLPDNVFSTISVGADLVVFQRAAENLHPELDAMFLEGELDDKALLDGTTSRMATDRHGKMVVKYHMEKNEMADKIYRHMMESIGVVKERKMPPVCKVRRMPVIPDAKMPPVIPAAKGMPPVAKVRKMPPPVIPAAKVPVAKLRKEKTDSSIFEWVSEIVPFMKRNYENMEQHPEDSAAREGMKKCYDSMLSMTAEKYPEAKVVSFHDMVDRFGAALSDEDRRFMSTLEKKTPEGWKPADIFYRDITRTEEKRELTAAEALASSLNMKGRVDMDYMSRVSSLDESSLVRELKGQIFFNAATMHYEEADLFLSGNVVEKARLIEKKISSLRDGQRKEAEDALEALKAARPMKVSFDDIDLSLGARWVPLDYYKQFICHAFSGNERSWDELDLFYVPATDQYVGSLSYRDNRHWYDWKVKTHDAGEMMLSAMQGALPKFTKQDPKDSSKSIVDEEATARAAKVIEEIRREWREWINLPAKAEMRRDLENIYNDRFNAEVRPKYDGSFQTFPGLRLDNLGISELYESQKDAIWMIKRNGGGVCWHEVGTGKTLIMCVAAYEMKRIGMCRKPVIIGLKANIAQIAETFRKAYPDAKLLFPTKENWTAQGRVDLFNQIKNNDWDCIIMTHDQFGYIPSAMKTEMRLMQEELDSMDDVLRDIDEKGRRKWSIMRGLQKRRERMKAKLEGRRQEIREMKDDVMDFHEMGIDHILVDESHYFKNLPFATRNERVGGIGNPTGSKRAWKLLTAIRDIQQRTGRDLGATFLSGTIVSNSLTELYIIFKYLRPEALAAQGIHSFDAWSAIFCELTRDFEVDVVGRIKAKERFSAYVNLPELGQFFRQITDYRTADMVGIDVPKAEQHFESAAPTPQQRVMIERLTAFVDNRDWNSLGIQRERPGKDQKAYEMALMLTATNLARQVSLDPRLLDDCKTFGDEMGNKVRRCAENIYRIYMETDHHKGTQFVFNDTSTLDSSKWNMQEALRDVLCDEYGIPSSEIAFINKASGDRQRLELFAKMNRGEVRVLIGSTTKLGTGVNAQERAVAVHHLDIPWRPSDMEQRNGRAIRKGNTVKEWGGNKVEVFIYATERTLDAYKFNLLKSKAMFIRQLNEGTVGVRRIDEDMVKDGDSAASYAEFLSILTGNDDLLKKAKLDAKLLAMEKDKAMFLRQRNQTSEQIASFEAMNKRDSEWVKLAVADCQKTEGMTAESAVIIDGKKTSGKKIGEELIRIGELYNRPETKEVGYVGDGWTIAVAKDIPQYPDQVTQCSFYLQGISGQFYRACQGSFRTGHITKGQGIENASHFWVETREEILREIESTKRQIQERSAKLPSMKAFCQKEWEGEEDLKVLREERDMVIASIQKMTEHGGKAA